LTAPTPAPKPDSTLRQAGRLVRHVSRPSRGLAVLLVLFWGWRVMSLVALKKWGYPLSLGDGLAFAWDLLLVAGWLALWQLAVGTGQNLWSRRLLGLLVGTGLTAALLSRGADVAYCALTGGRFSSAGFLYLNAENVGLLRDGDGPLLCSIFLASCLVTYGVLYRMARRRESPPPARLGARSLALVGALGSFALPLVVGSEAIEEDHHRFVPEAFFVHEWLVWRGLVADPYAGASELSHALAERFRATGLISEEPLRPGFPLSRPTLDLTPFPHPKTPGADERGRPNLVLTLVEQLNHEFVHAFSGDFPGVMPELSALAKRMTMVTDYQSTANPTIHALVASLCSVHCASHDRELNRGRGSEALVRTPMTCLPSILRSLGYRTVFIQGGKKEFAGKSDFLLTHGFDEMHGQPELAARFPGRDISTWGAHDDALVEYAEEQVRRLEALRAKDGRPYFLMMLTLDTHSPGLPPPECAMPESLNAISSDRNSRLMLRSLHCTDAALARLGRFLTQDPARSKNTLWALSGDHPTSAMRFVSDLHKRKGHPYTGWSGRLPLMIYDPSHTLPARVPVLASHIDLAPTLLHLIGAGDVPNSMTGHSIFGRRPKLPMLVGRVGPKYVALYRPGSKTRSMTPAFLKELCEQKKPVFEGDAYALDACELLAWLRLQDALWQEKRLYPRTLPTPSAAMR
jgi:arylsulfatase A-like enzyme